MHRTSYALLVAVLTLLSLSRHASASIFSIDPAATYLLTNNDAAPNATAFGLASLGVQAGDFIRLERLGNFDYNLGQDNGTSLVAVFSSSSELLATSELNRVVGALKAGDAFATGPTHHGSLSNDIAEDFFVPGSGNSVVVKVPVGALFLFFSTNDSYFNDNTDPDGNFGVRITSADNLRVSSAPAPSSFLIFALGGTTAWSLRRFRGRGRTAA